MKRSDENKDARPAPPPLKVVGVKVRSQVRGGVQSCRAGVQSCHSGEGG